MSLQRGQDETRDYRMPRRGGRRPRLHVRYRPGRLLDAAVQVFAASFGQQVRALRASAVLLVFLLLFKE